MRRCPSWLLPNFTRASAHGKGKHYPKQTRSQANTMMTQQAHPSIPQCSTLVELLRHRAAQDPDRTALTFLADADTIKGSLTYAQLDHKARAIAAMLQARGLTGQRALLVYPPGLDYITAFFGCLYAGTVAVPTYPPRRNRSSDRLQAIIANAQAAAVLTTPTLDAFAGRHWGQTLSRQPLHWLLTDEAADDARAWQQPTLSGATLAVLQYTSGSTAAPRGVMLSHANLLHNSRWIERCFEHSRDSRGVIWLPPYHDMGLIGGIIQPLHLGCSCYLMSPTSVFSNPFSWLEAVSRYRASTSGGPNFAYELCLRKITAQQRATLDLSCWQVAFTGAEPVHADTLERFAASFASCGFRRQAFYPCYGLAEATLMAAAGNKKTPPQTLRVHKASLEANQAVPAAAEEPGSQTLVGCGHSLADQQIVIVHPEKLTCCRSREIGEIWIAGPSVAQGYWDQPELSRQTFAAHLADSGEGPFLRTGDLGFLHEGELFITGRLKDLIILCGRNLYPQDLERTAERSHADLNPCCGAAFSVESEGQERLVLVYELIPRREPDVSAVAEVVRRALAEEHEVELYALVLVKLGGMPKTSSGKIQRQACRKAFLSGTLEAYGEWRARSRPCEDGLLRAAVLAVPASERQGLLERYFREQLARVLRLNAALIDVHQPVNTLGLDSLTTLELKNALGESLGVYFPVTRFLGGASISTLAAQVLTELSPQASAALSPSLSSLVQQVQQLSDEQVKELLQAQPAVQ
jgi:acyl-CoA synthetase (AMP-forming)/AMP-acid ligase II/acyl carrier protein